jgi:hypothetical protein
MGRLLILTPLLTLVGLPCAKADVLWRGNFETCDLAQWRRVYRSKPYSIEVGRDYVHEGRCGARFEVRPGDTGGIPGGDRAMVVGPSFVEGQTVWFRWSTRFSGGFPKSAAWAVVWEMHQQADWGTPPLEIIVATENADGSPTPEELRLRLVGKDLWRTRLQRSQWYDFVLGVHFSKDPKIGWVELYVGGRRALKRTPTATMIDELDHLVIGYYRKKDQPIVGVVYHDGVTTATTRCDLMSCDP